MVLGDTGKLILIYGFSSIITRLTDLNCEHTTFFWFLFSFVSSFTNRTVQIIQELRLVFTCHTTTTRLTRRMRGKKREEQKENNKSDKLLLLWKQIAGGGGGGV